jgi:hypothetical protein
MRLCAICNQPLPPLAKRYCSEKCGQISADIAAAAQPSDRRGPTNINNDRDLWLLKQANLRHLLDLKLAGHSPRRTELRMKKPTIVKRSA